MSRRVKTIALPFALLGAYVLIAGLMWFVAYRLEEDKSRAAMIGAASAFSVGGAAFLGGWFNAWRTSRLQQARERTARKEEAYGRWLAVLADYRGACRDVGEYTRRIDDSQLSPDAIELAKEKLSTARYHAREVLLSLELASAPIEVVGSDAVRQAMASVMQSLRDANPSEVVIDDSTSSRFLIEAKVDLQIEE